MAKLGGGRRNDGDAVVTVAPAAEVEATDCRAAAGGWAAGV